MKAIQLWSVVAGVILTCSAMDSVIRVQAQGVEKTVAATTTASTSVVSTATAAKDNRETLAVSTIKATTALEAKVSSAGKTSELLRFTQSMDSVLSERFSAARKFRIVARNDADLGAILAEQSLGASKNVEEKSSAKIGQMLGAKYLLVIAIDDFQDRTRNLKVDESRVRSIRDWRISAIAKLYNSTTGELLEASTQSITNEMQKNLNSATLSDEGNDMDQMIAQASRKMADRLVQYVTDIIYPAKVVGATNGFITINRGEGTDIQRGQIWVVYAVGEEMTDPDTGESLGAEEVPLCRAKVTSVKPKTSTLQLLSDDPGVERGMVARPASKDDSEVTE